MAEQFAPRLNHVAVTMGPAQLDEGARADIVAFYGEVFGWTEGDNTGESGNPLILYTGAFGQFVYLQVGEQAPAEDTLDHFGLLVSTVEELDGMLDRAKRYRERDDRVRIVDRASRTTHGPSSDYTLTSCYIGYLLPFTIELQHLERQP